jgi:hypothetical protein
MQRRNFVKVMAAAATPWARAESIDPKAMRDLAAAVLPESLGRKRTDKISADFLKWIAEYKEGVNTAAGYGHPRTQTVPPNPSKNYAAQLGAFNGVITKESVAAALEKANIDRIPNRPNGRHPATDLIAYFYSSPAGEDFLYGVEIKRNDCRGLASSGQRPKRWT